MNESEFEKWLLSKKKLRFKSIETGGIQIYKHNLHCSLLINDVFMCQKLFFCILFLPCFEVILMY